MSAIGAVVSWIKRFRAAQSGAAAVEFALILPIMLMLYIGANEASVLITMDRKVQMVSGAVGDLVARSEEEISFATLSDYIKVASGLVSPYAVKDMEQIVTHLVVDANGVAKVDWSRGYKNQVATSTLNRATNSIYKLPAAVSNIAKGRNVIVAETRMPYMPLYGVVYKAPVTLYRENFYLPRFDTPIKLN